MDVKIYEINQSNEIIDYFVQNGFVVMLPNIRGSSGYGKKFEDSNFQDWGHGDLRDIVAGVDILKSLGYVNKSKISIHGTSYGGCISMSAVCFEYIKFFLVSKNSLCPSDNIGFWNFFGPFSSSW